MIAFEVKTETNIDNKQKQAPAVNIDISDYDQFNHLSSNKT